MRGVDLLIEIENLSDFKLASIVRELCAPHAPLSRTFNGFAFRVSRSKRFRLQLETQNYAVAFALAL